jgi:hypothetical protein
MKARPLSLFCALTVLTCAGCSNPSHLVFHQSAAIGVDVAANVDSGQIHVSVGYDRQTNTLIPKTKLDDGENEAMSVVSASKVDIKWLGVHEVTEQFATGHAAVNVAANPESAGQVLTITQPTRQLKEGSAR